MSNTHKIDNGWLISYGKRRANAAKAQAHDLLLTSARNAAHDTTPRPVERLPFKSDNPAPATAKHYVKPGVCVFEGGVTKFFVYTPMGTPVASALLEAEANVICDRFNNGVRDAGVQRFATGRKYRVVS